MIAIEWIRRQFLRRREAIRGERRRSFHKRLQASLAVKPLESRLVLSATVLPALGTELLFAANGDLQINDVATGGHAENLTISTDATTGELVLFDPNSTFTTASEPGSAFAATGVPGVVISPDGHTVNLPLNLISGKIQINGMGGDDHLTVDLSSGNFSNAIEFNGGAPTTLPGDSISLVGGGTFANVKHNFFSADSGSIEISGNALISYTGLEPVIDNLNATNRVFDFQGGSETITVDLGSAVGSGLDNSIRSTLGESVAFNNPTASLTINAGTGDDVVNVLNLDAAFSANVFINGNAGNDTLNVTAVSAGSYTIHGNGGDDTVVIQSVAAGVSISAFGDAGSNSLTVETVDTAATDPLFEFAGFVFDETDTPDVATAIPTGTLAGGDGVVITDVTGGATGVVNFPANPAPGFDDSLTIGRLLGGGAGARAVNLPSENNGRVVRSAIELNWTGGRTLTNLDGDDFVVYESSSNPTGPDAFMVQVHVFGLGWTRWRYEVADSRENYPGQGNSGAFATAFDLSDFGLADSAQIDSIRIASMTGADRIDGPGVETTTGSGIFRGEGFVIPDDGGATSDVQPYPGDVASFDFFGNATFDPDPLYVGMLHPLAATTNFRDDIVEVDDSTVKITTEGVAQPTLNYSGFDTLSVNTNGGTDEVIVHLGGNLPSTINVDGGDPTSTDTLTVIGDPTLADDLTLENSQVSDNNTGKVITLANTENVVVDFSGDSTNANPFVDVVTIERNFTLPGTSASIHVEGDVLFDKMIVNTESPPPVVVPTPVLITAVGVQFDQNSTPDILTHYADGFVLPGGNGVTANQPAFDTGSSAFPGGVQPLYDGSLSIGRLSDGTTGTSRFLNMPAGNNGTTTRSVFELNWTGSRTLTDGAGDDIVIYESGSAGAPEPFMIQVHRTDSTVNSGWSEWYYFPASDFDGSISSFVSSFDLANMGLAGVTIDAIRVANLIDADRMASASRVGVVLPGIGGNAFPRPLPGPEAANPNGTFGNSSLDPDIIYVGVTQPLNLPPNSFATTDIVNIDSDSVDIVGFTPITYSGLEEVTVNTGGGSDRITVTPTVDTQIVINGEDPDFPTFAGDRLEFELDSTTNPTLTITDPGTGMLTMGNRRDVVVSGIETFGVVPSPGSGTKFAVQIDADSSSLANTADNGQADTFTVIRNDRNSDVDPDYRGTTEVIVNGQIVFRGERAAIDDLNITGSSDDDSLSVDFERGNPIPTGGVHFVGRGGTNDLEVVNGWADTVTHNFTSTTAGNIVIDRLASNNAGTITNVSSLITYTGITQPIFDDLLANNRIFNFTSAVDDIRLLDAGTTTDGRSAIINGPTATTFVEVTFRNPVEELTVNAMAGSDLISLEAVDLNYAAETTLNGQGGNDTITIDDNGSAAGGSVDFVTFVVNVHGGGQNGDKLFVNDTSDTTGDSFNITETTIGGDELPPGAAAGKTGTAGAIDWSQILTTFASGARPEVDGQTILHWLFAEGVGTITNDLSANNNDGTLRQPTTNAPELVFDATRGDNVLHFDGVDDFASFRDPNFDIGAAGTFSLWVNMADQGRRNSLLNSADSFPGNGMEFEFRTNHGGELFAYLNKLNASDDSLILERGDTGTQVPNAGTWFNIQFVWDINAVGGPMAHIYIDGSEVAYEAAFDNTVAGWTQALDTINVLFQLGRHRSDPSRFFEGSMDDVAFYDRALNTSELTSVRNGTFDSGTQAPNLVAYWSFDNAPGSVVLPTDAGFAIDLNLGDPVSSPEFVTPAASGLVLPGTGTQLPALDFDGNGDRVVAAASPSLDFDKSTGTISFWINPSGEQIRNTVEYGSTTLIEDTTEQIEVGIFWRTDAGDAHGHEDYYGRIYFSPHEDSANDSTNIIVSNTRLVSPDGTLPANTWTHVTITWDLNATDGPLAHIYINGQDDGALVDNLPMFVNNPPAIVNTPMGSWNPVATNTGDWVFGGDAAAVPLARDFDGMLADVTILGTALSASQVNDIFLNGAEATNPYDLAGTDAKFTWDSTNLYGRLDAYPAGSGTANGPFQGYVVEIYDSTGNTLLNTVSVMGTPASNSYEFTIPFSSLGNFDPTLSGAKLQYRVTTIDFDMAGAGFDTVDTTLGFVQAPIAGATHVGTYRTGNLGVLNFTTSQNFFGLGGRLTYDGIADLDITTGSGDDVVTVKDDPTVNNNPLANAASTFTLRTGAGNDAVTIESIDDNFSAATTILGQGGTDSITQLDDLNLGSSVSTGNLLYVAESINLGADLSSTGGTATYDGATTLLTNVRIDTDRTDNGSQGGAILFTRNTSIDSEAGETNNLILDAGTSTISFNEDIGSLANGELGRLEVEQADGGVTFGGAEDDVAGSFGPVNVINTKGAIDIGSEHVITGSGIVLNGGTAGSIAISTAGNNVRLNGAVTLATNVTIDTDSTDNNTLGGDIIFTNDAPVDSAAGENNDLTLDAGTGTVRFNEDLGKTRSLGALTVHEADGGVIFGEANTEVVGSGGKGPVNVVNTTDGINIGTGNDAILGSGIVLNGGNNPLVMTSTNDLIRFNGAVTLRSDVQIDTGAGGGDILFTNDSPINGEANESNDLTLNAGMGEVRFNEDLGTQERIGALTIEKASHVVFGEVDTEVAGSGTTGPVNNVRTSGPINIGSLATITGGIELNGGNSLLTMSTTGDDVRFDGATLLSSDVDIDTDPADAHQVGGDITFTSNSPIDSAAGEHNDLTLDAGNRDILFDAIIGGTHAPGNIMIDHAHDVNFARVFRASGDVTQIDGTGTTMLHGTFGAGIGGNLALTTNVIKFTTADVVTVGDVDLKADNTVSLTNGGGLDAGNSTISIAANRDGKGNSPFENDSSAEIRTTNQTPDAVLITVGGVGNAKIATVRAGTNGGGITVKAGGGIVDNSPTEDPNFIAHTATLTAGNGIGAGTKAGNDIDTRVSDLAAPASRGDIIIDEVDDIRLIGLDTSTGKVVIDAAGVLSIKDETSVNSVTGVVSNAPPLLRLREADPDDVIIPGRPNQEVVGTIGGIRTLGDNKEVGENFTLTVTWADGIVSVVRGLKAGDHLTWYVGPNGESKYSIDHGDMTMGAITVSIQREFTLEFLQTVHDPDVLAAFVVDNDPNIILNDSQTVNNQPLDLNMVGPVRIATAISNLEFRYPPIIVQTDTITAVEQPRPNFLVNVVTFVDNRTNNYDQQIVTIEEKKEEVAQLFLVHVDPDGTEGIRVSLPLSELHDLSRLLRRLEKAPIPNGLYRIYHQEPGLPPRKILEFRKTGNSIADPIREPGRGSNPLESPPPANDQGNLPNNNDGAALVPDQVPIASTGTGDTTRQVQQAMPQAQDRDFSRAARWRRSLIQ